MKPHAYSLRQLQYALAVADTGGFRRAAERCHVSQPSLSGQLALLEQTLGVRLFERNRRRAILTAAGDELIARARAILTAADDLLLAAQRLADPFTGSFHLGVLPTISPYFLPGLTPRIKTRFPALRLLWTEDRTATLLRELREGRLDGAVLARTAGMEDLAYEPILNDAFVLAGAPTHPLLRTRRPLKPEELDGQSVLLLEDGHCFRDQALAICQTAHAREGGFRATSLATLSQMAASGAGLTLLPSLAVPVENRRGDLAIRPFTRPAPSREIVLCWRKGSPLAAALSELARSLRGELVAPAAANGTSPARRRQAI